MRSTALKAETNCQQFSLLKQALDSFDNCLQAVHTFDSFCKILKFIMNISITKRIWKKLRLLPSGVGTFPAHFLPYLLFFCNWIIETDFTLGPNQNYHHQKLALWAAYAHFFLLACIIKTSFSIISPVKVVLFSVNGVFHICFHDHTLVWLIRGAGLILRQGATDHCAQNVPPQDRNAARISKQSKGKKPPF